MLVYSFICEAECLLQTAKVCLPTFLLGKNHGSAATCGECKYVKYPKLSGCLGSVSINLSVWSASVGG